jgi:hypothetical protein
MVHRQILGDPSAEIVRRSDDALALEVNRAYSPFSRQQAPTATEIPRTAVHPAHCR